MTLRLLILIWLLLISNIGCLTKDNKEKVESLFIFEKVSNPYGFQTYRAEIFDTGEVIFSNVENIKNENSLIKFLSQDELDKIKAAFVKINFLSLKDKYIETPSECPQVLSHTQAIRTTFYLKSKGKTVSHLQGCKGTIELANIEWLEKTIEKMINKEPMYIE